jgi:glycosyltransferase involved in cell wall biosynthesis
VTTGAPPESAARLATARVVLLTNFIPPYRAPLFRRLAERFGAFEVFVSTEMEANRSWQADWDRLQVTVLPGPTLNRTVQHPHQFASPSFVHLPVTALGPLWRAKPDVVVSGQLGLGSALAALYCALRRRTGLVLWLTLSEISELSRGRLRQVLRRLLLARADAVMVNGASGARYARRFGTPESKIFRVFQAIDVDAFACRRARPERATRRLLFVGSREPRKGLRPFLRQLAEWAAAHPRRGVELRVAGSRDASLAAESRRLPANLVVNWLGDVAYAEMPSVYAEADILAFPTLCDEWGLVANEAMAAGIPVLGSLFSQAVEELVEDGRHGWTYHPDRPEECRSAIDRALSAPSEELAAMGRACRERIADFSFDRVAERMVAAVAHALPAPNDQRPG